MKEVLYQHQCKWVLIKIHLCIKFSPQDISMYIFNSLLFALHMSALIFSQLGFCTFS